MTGSWARYLALARKFPKGATGAVVLFLLIAVPPQALWFLNGLGFAERLGLEAVVIAIALGIPALNTAIQHAKELDAVATRLGSLADFVSDVAASVPTRGIGVFPEYLSEVVGLVDRATSSIKILCDTPGHGAFSNADVFDAYFKRLQYQIVDNGVEIECTFLDAPGRKKMHEAQIAEYLDRWKEWQELNRGNCAAFADLAASLDINPPSQEQATDPIAQWAATPEMYVESAMAINERVLRTIYGAKVNVEQLTFGDPLHEGPSVYFWLRDHDQEAVFVIVPVRGIGVRDFAGFHTKEPVLIRALYTVFEHRKVTTKPDRR